MVEGSVEDYVELCKSAKKKIIIALIYFISIFTPVELDHPEIDSIEPPLRPLLVARPILAPLRRVCLFLVGCCVKFVIRRPPKATICFIFLIFHRLIHCPK
jgi:hypothetical protein